MNLNTYRMAALAASITIAVVGNVAVAAGSSARVTNGPTAAVAATVSVGSGEVVFVPLTPCRLVDTRPDAADAKLISGIATPFHAIGSDFSAQGGSPTGCGVSADAKAIAVNFTMLNTTASGDVRMWATNQTMPFAGVGVFNPPGEAIYSGGSAIVPLCQSGCPSTGEFQIYPDNADLDIVVNVTGYFHAATSTTTARVRASTGARSRATRLAAPRPSCATTAPRIAAPVRCNSPSVQARTRSRSATKWISPASHSRRHLTAVELRREDDFGENSQTPTVPVNGTANMPWRSYIEMWTPERRPRKYSTLNYSPTVTNSTANVSGRYIDAFNDTSGSWGLTGGLLQ